MFWSSKIVDCQDWLTDKSAEDDDIFLHYAMMLTFIIIIMSQDNVTDYSP